MLAEQGKLADLVEQNLILPKRPSNLTPIPKPTKKKKDGGKRKKKGRSKVKRRRWYSGSFNILKLKILAVFSLVSLFIFILFLFLQISILFQKYCFDCVIKKF